MPLFSDFRHGKEATRWLVESEREGDGTKITFDLHWCAKCHIEFQLLRWNFVSTFHFGPSYIYMRIWNTFNSCLSNSFKHHAVHNVFAIVGIVVQLIYISTFFWHLFMAKQTHWHIAFHFIAITDREKKKQHRHQQQQTTMHNIVYDILIYSIYTNKHINTVKCEDEDRECERAKNFNSWIWRERASDTRNFACLVGVELFLLKTVKQVSSK